LLKLGTKVTFYDTSSIPGKTIPFGVEYKNSKQIPINLICFVKFIINIHILLKYVFTLKIYNPKNIIKYFIRSLRLFVVISKSKFNLIHSQHASDRSIAPLIIGQMLNLPVVVTTYTSEFSSGSKRYKNRNARICNLADYNIFISNHALSLSKHHGNKNNCSKVIYLGVDYTDFNPNYSTDEFKENYSITNEIIIVYVGWLTKRKGPQVLLNAINSINHNKVKIFIVGPDHGLKEYLQFRIKEMSLQKSVFLLGKVNNDTLRKIYSLCDIFIFPTITNDEGFGLVAVEAMASGCIVIASNIAAIPEVVKDGVSGYLFEPNNHFDLADKINYVINSCDYLRMKDKSRQYAINNFSWEKMAKDTKSTYENVLTYMKSSI